MTGRIKMAVLSRDAEKETVVLTEMAGNVHADCCVDFSMSSFPISHHHEAGAKPFLGPAQATTPSH